MTTKPDVSVPVQPRFGWKFNAVGVTGFCILLFWLVIATIGPYLTPYPVGEIITYDYYSAPSAVHWLGTDYLGRDMFSRVVSGARYTVAISAAGAFLACSIGVCFGMIAAIRGGWFDMFLSRGMDALNGIPSLMFGLVIVAAVGSSIPVLIMTLVLIYTPGSYRFARSLSVNVNTADFVTVARARGERMPYLIRIEILPNITSAVLADLGLRFVFMVLLLSGLSFLGLGVQPPVADWGGLVRENLGGLTFGAWTVIYPSICIASLTISVNLLIDNLPTKIRDR